MKKILKTMFVIALCGCFGLALTACDSEPYSKYDLSEYITLPDYNAYEVSVPEVEITDDEIDAEIEARLEDAATTEEITEGTVSEGDTVTIAFEGALADGTEVSGMSSEGTTLTLGSGTMIDGFEEGLYGATIGETVTLNLTFPDPYTTNEELSGQDAIFEVTVLNKEVTTVPELDEEFVKANSDYETVAEYRASVAAELEQYDYDEQLYYIKSDLYSQLVEDTVVIQYPKKELKKEIKSLTKSYKQLAENSGVSWDDYLTDTLGVDQEEFDEEIELYAQELIKQEMIIYAIAEQEGLSVTDEEYDAYLNSMLTYAGFEDEDAFKDYTGMSLKEYAETYKLDRDLLLTKELDTIYERLVSTDDTTSTDEQTTTETE